jgi:DNA topoisomerase-1
VEQDDRPPGILGIGTLSSETFSPGPNYFRGPAVAGYVGKAASFRFFALLDRNDEKVGYFRIGIDRQRKRVTEQRWDWQKGIWVNDPECRISWWMVNGTDEMLEVDNPGFGNLSKASKNVPINPKLYAKVKAEARAKFDVYPSAYANGWLVQEYKRRGGEYRTVTKQQPGSSEVHVPSTNWKTKRKKERGLSSLVNKHQTHNQESHGKWAKAGFRAASEEDYAQVQAELGKKIPPGWTDVVVSQTKEGINGCRVIGTDAKGRQQYWYTKEHTERASAEKWHRVGALHEVIGPKDNKFDERLKAEALDDNSAAALLLVRVTGMRVGGSRDTGAKVQAYGATTLQGRHVRINKSSVTLEFTGKGGKKRRVLVKDPTLVTALTRAKENTGPSGKLFPNTSSSQVNTLMKSLLGDRFSVKDLRTYKATAMAAALVQKTRRKPKTQAEFDKMRREVGDKVAQQLGNTRSMALNSYINPAAFAPWNGALANE